MCSATSALDEAIAAGLLRDGYEVVVAGKIDNMNTFHISSTENQELSCDGNQTATSNSLRQLHLFDLDTQNPLAPFHLVRFLRERELLQKVLYYCVDITTLVVC
jgi:hypothetical protein